MKIICEEQRHQISNQGYVLECWSDGGIQICPHKYLEVKRENRSLVISVAGNSN